MEDLEIHSESNVCSTAHRHIKVYRFDVHAGFERGYRSLGDGDVLRRGDGHVLRRSLDFEVDGQRKKGRPKMTWKMQVEEQSVKVGLKWEFAFCRPKWSVGINQIAAGLMLIWPPSLVWDTTRF